MSFKTIIVLNSQFEAPTAVLVNAACHLAQGLGHEQNDAHGSSFVRYVDADRRGVATVATSPLILLRGKTAKMWAFFDALEQADVPRGAFVDSMIEGGSDVQLERTRQLPRSELGLVAVAGFASAELLAPLTKRFSVWTPRGQES